jgi:hypothetical protein
MTGERDVYISLMAPITNSTMPTTSRETVSAADPGQSEMSTKAYTCGGKWVTRTTLLAIIESQQQTDYARNDEGQSEEVKIANMFPEGAPFTWVQVEKEEEDEGRGTACWEVEEEYPG